SGFPFVNRPYAHKNFIFNLNIKYNRTKVFYFRLESKTKSPLIFKIRTSEFLLGYSTVEYYLLGLFYGILAIIAVYNLIIYVYSKERVYLFYVFYVVACGLTTFNEDGMGFQFLWPNHPQLNLFLLKYTAVMLVASFVFYALSYLEINRKKPLIFWPIIISMLVYAVYKILNSTFGTLYHEFPILFLLPFALVYVAAILEWKNGNRSARLFVIGYTFIVGSSLITYLRTLGLIVENALTVYSLNYSFVIEVIILSIALMEKFGRERKEREKTQLALIEQLKENQRLKDQMNKELEEKVAERTKQLAQKNEELTITLYQLEEANHELVQQKHEIEALNEVLHQDNQNLKLNLDKQAKARLMFEDMSFEDFEKVYPDEDSCLKLLAETKWVGEFKCRRCENNQFFPGRSPYSKRCTKCGYEESATAYTIMHGTKIPLQKAFYMVYLVSTRQQDISSEEISRILNMRQKTCWSFKNKIVVAINRKNTDYKHWGELLLEDVY
ncbi:MAG: 7TM diverse intracellular signaling domain-containing protein, partial [Cytophagales bacterium]